MKRRTWEGAVAEWDRPHSREEGKRCHQVASFIGFFWSSLTFYFINLFIIFREGGNFSFSYNWVLASISAWGDVGRELSLFAFFALANSASVWVENLTSVPLFPPSLRLSWVLEKTGGGSANEDGEGEEMGAQ